MKIRIGIQHAPRELDIETDTPAEEVLEALKTAVDSGSTAALRTTKGGTVLIPGGKLAYAEVSDEQPRPVGFLG